jgi:hypothetical protein
VLVEPESEFTEVLVELETLDKAEAVLVESVEIALVKTGWTSLPIVLTCFWSLVFLFFLNQVLLDLDLFFLFAIIETVCALVLVWVLWENN